MYCKVACRTANHYWFIWEDILFSTPASAREYINKQKDYIRDDLFLVFPSPHGWSR